MNTLITPPYNMTSFIIEKITPEIEKKIARMTGRG
jgi:hypothetical protein